MSTDNYSEQMVVELRRIADALQVLAECVSFRQLGDGSTISSFKTSEVPDPR